MSTGLGRRSFKLVALAFVAACALPPGASTAHGFVGRGPFLVTSPQRPLFAGPPLAPGQARARCLAVTNLGDDARMVRLYGRTTEANGLQRYLHLTVVEGSGSCDAFHPMQTMFAGVLRELPTRYEDGLRDGARWPSGTSRVYRLTVPPGAGSGQPGPRVHGVLRLAGPLLLTT